MSETETVRLSKPAVLTLQRNAQYIGVVDNIAHRHRHWPLTITSFTFGAAHRRIRAHRTEGKSCANSNTYLLDEPT